MVLGVSVDWKKTKQVTYNDTGESDTVAPFYLGRSSLIRPRQGEVWALRTVHRVCFMPLSLCFICPLPYSILPRCTSSLSLFRTAQGREKKTDERVWVYFSLFFPRLLFRYCRRCRWFSRGSLITRSKRNGHCARVIKMAVHGIYST